MSEEATRRTVRQFPENGMKALLQRPGNVRELLTLADCELVPRIDFDAMTVDPTTYVTADYSHVSSDIVLTVPLRAVKKGRRKRQLSLTVLFEHQSDPERLMLLRVLDYLVQIWKHQIRQWEEQHGSRASVKLQPILPVVFYTGTFRWERLGKLTDLMDGAEGLERHIPVFEPLFVNLPELSEEALGRGGSFGQILRVLQRRKASQPTFRGAVTEAASALEAMPDEERPRRQDLLSYLTQALYHYRGEAEADGLVSMVRQAARLDEFRLEVDMARRTKADALIEEGETLALRQTLVLLLKQRFDPLPADVEQTVQDTADLPRLREWVGKVFPAKSLADIGITPRPASKR